MTTHTKSPTSAAGFTIIELLIATSIFTLVLILVTTGVLQFTRQYYKGVVSGQTQTVARAIIDDAAQAIQFNSGTVDPLVENNGSKGFCIGSSKRYSYLPNYQVTDGTPDAAQFQSRFGLVSDDRPSCSGDARDLKATNTISGDNARELLGRNMRLVKFDIVENDGLYTVTVRVAYGDSDLLCSPTTANSCEDETSAFPLAADDLRCRLVIGSQFCAVSELSTTVKKRVN
jgi:type II secretory pathway pseudopilin PulG